MNARQEALCALIDIIENGAYANLRLKEAGGAHGAAVYALVHVTLEHLYYIDYVLQNCAKRQKRVVRNILRIGAAELLYMNEPSYAVINEAVTLCKRNGKQDSAALVNAVLRRVDNEKLKQLKLPDDPVERLSIVHSYPVWIVRMWTEAYGTDTASALLKAHDTGMEIRAQYPYTNEELEKTLEIPYTRGTVDPNCFRLARGMDVSGNLLFANGCFTVQNQGSMAVCRALGDMRGKKVLDACSAPGGKAAYLYSLCGGDISLTCWELHPHRKELLDATLARLHVQAETTVRDASVRDETYDECFDAVLLDAPCSGLGLLRDKVDIRYNRKQEDLPALVSVQADILDTCCHYVRPGGVLLYATCTISCTENELQARAFLDRHAEFALDREQQYLPSEDGVDGFYYARMIRCN